MRGKFIFGIVLLLIVGLTSCTIEKRHYRDGFYVDRNRNVPEKSEVASVHEPTAAQTLLTRILRVSDTTSTVVIAKEQDELSLTADRALPNVVAGKSEQETPEEVLVHSEKSKSPAPIKKDKNQAVGAGVAGAIFFLVAMAGLFIKGTAPPVGVFIVGAFVCCILCIMLASFLYPREPVVKQPKDETVVKNKGIAAAGIGLLTIVFVICALIAALVISIFTELFF